MRAPPSRIWEQHRDRSWSAQNSARIPHEHDKSTHKRSYSFVSVAEEAVDHQRFAFEIEIRRGGRRTGGEHVERVARIERAALDDGMRSSVFVDTLSVFEGGRHLSGERSHLYRKQIRYDVERKQIRSTMITTVEVAVRDGGSSSVRGCVYICVSQCKLRIETRGWGREWLAQGTRGARSRHRGATLSTTTAPRRPALTLLHAIAASSDGCAPAGSCARPCTRRQPPCHPRAIAARRAI